METVKSRFNQLGDDIREYVETRIELAKIDTADAAATGASGLLSWLIVGVLGLVVLIIVSIGISITIGNAINNLAAGFFITVGAYILVILLLYFNRDKWIRKPLLNSIIKNIYDND